mmetsp:Transcript_48475/g.113420  ORF Transcript_48475/g.113420 Transcript_48475/m.113420 type:complete len:262 (-) Transcript_48475:131-916(-)
MKAMFTTRPSARGTESGPSKAENLIRNMRPTAPADTKAEPAKYSFDPTEYLYKNLSEADADKLRTQQAAAHTLLVQHTTSAYDAGKTLLRASHIVNQYVSLAAGILVCLSSAEAFVEIIFGGIGLWFIGGLTQFYLFCFGLTIIVLEVPIMDKTTPVLKFKVMIDKWFRALSRLTARGIVYFTHAVLIINAQEVFFFRSILALLRCVHCSECLLLFYLRLPHSTTLTLSLLPPSAVLPIPSLAYSYSYSTASPCIDSEYFS